MIKGLYTSALGLSVLSKQQEVTANNLANAQTVGYKKDILLSESFPEMLLHRLHDSGEEEQIPSCLGQVPLGVKINDVFIDHSPGVGRLSENPLDLAIQEGFFVVQTPRGERYTRNGQFAVDNQGRLVTAEGYPVLGAKGEIVVGDSNIQVDPQGQIFREGAVIDRLQIVHLEAITHKEGASLLQGTNPREVANPHLQQGMVEESNVDPIREMVQMITTLRSYEANQKVIQAIDATLDKAVNEVGRV